MANKNQKVEITISANNTSQDVFKKTVVDISKTKSATDDLNKSLSETDDAFGSIINNASIVRDRFNQVASAAVNLSLSIATLSVNAFKSLSLIPQAFSEIRSAINSDIGQTIFGFITKAAEDALSGTAKLTEVIESLSFVTGGVSQGFGQKLFKIEPKTISQTINEGINKGLNSISAAAFDPFKEFIGKAAFDSLNAVIAEIALEEIVSQRTRGTVDPESFKDYLSNPVIQSILNDETQDLINGSFTTAITKFGKRRLSEVTLSLFNDAKKATGQSAFNLGTLIGTNIFKSIEVTQRTKNIRSILGGSFKGLGETLLSSAGLGNGAKILGNQSVLDFGITELINSQLPPLLTPVFDLGPVVSGITKFFNVTGIPGLDRVDQAIGKSLAKNVGKAIDFGLTRAITPVISGVANSIEKAGQSAITKVLVAFVPKAFKKVAQSRLENGGSATIFSAIAQQLNPGTAVESLKAIDGQLLIFQQKVDSVLVLLNAVFVGLKSNLDKIRDGIIRIAPSIQSGLVGGFIIFERVVNQLKIGVNSLFSFLKNGIAKIQDNLPNLVRFIDRILVGVKNLGGQAFRGIFNALDAFKGTSFGSSFATQISSIQSGIETAGTIFSDVIERIIDRTDDFEEALFNIGERAKDVMTDAASFINDELLDRAVDGFGDFLSSISDRFDEDNLTESFAGIGKFVDNIISGIGVDGDSGFGEFFDEFSENFRDGTADFVADAIPIIESISLTIDETISDIQDGVFSVLSGVFSFLGSQIGTFFTTEFPPGVEEAIDRLFGGLFSGLFEETVQNAGREFVTSLFGAGFARIVPAVNLLDEGIISLYTNLSTLSSTLSEPLDQLSELPGAIAGFNEPLQIFGILENAVSQFGDTVSGVLQKITFFSEGLSVLQQFAATGPFQAFIGQTVELQEQLLSTQSTLVGTSKIISGLSGDEIIDPTTAIKSLESPIRNAVNIMRKESLELVGVTSKELVPIFDLVAGRITSIGGGLTDAKDLSIDFAATLGTLNVPLFQAQQEISSILTGQIDQNSVVAKALNITNQQVNTYKEQGRLIDELRKKLSAFRAGNALAAQTLNGVSSNVQEVFDEIARKSGEKLLAPLVKEIDAVYKFLEANESEIVAYFEKITGNVLTIGLSVVEVVKKIAGSIGGLVVEAPLYLFESLANAVIAFADAVKFAIDLLQPAINVLTEFFKIALPLGGQFLQLFASAKVLAVGLKAVGSGFGTLLQLVPGLGEVLFALDIRTNGVINQFAKMTQVVGPGTAGFLLLGKNLAAIPGAMGAIETVLGPFAGFVAGLAPTIAAVGIQLVGLIKLFPPIGAFFGNLLTVSPAVITSLAAFARTNVFLAPLAPLLDSASAGLLGLAGAADRTAFVNERFRLILVELGKNLAAQAILYASVAGAAFIAFRIVDEFVLKNEQLKEILSGVAQGLVEIGEMFISGFSDPMVLATTALGLAVTGLNVAVAFGLAPTLYTLIGIQIASWATTAATAFTFLSTALSTLGLTGLAASATTASIGLNAFAIFMTQGSAASSAFLTANGINIISLATLNAQLQANIVSLRTFIFTKYADIVAFKAHVLSIIATSVALIRLRISGIIPTIVALIRATLATRGASGGFLALARSVIVASIAMARRLINSILLAISSLIALGTSATTGSFSFSLLARNIFLSGLSAIKAGIKYLLALPKVIALGNGALVAAGKFGVLATGIAATVGSIAVLLAPLALIAAAVGAIGLIRYTKQLKDSNEAVEILSESTNFVADRSLKLSQRLKNASDAQAEANKRGIRLTDEQYKQNLALKEQAELEKTNLQEQITTLKEFKETVWGDEAKRNLQTQIDLLNGQVSALDKYSTSVEIQAKDLQRLGGGFEQLALKATGAEQAIVNSNGDVDIFKKNAEELIDITQQQIAAGQISGEEARRRFRLIATNSAVDVATQGKTQEAITATYIQASEERIDIVKSQQEAISSQLAAGAIDFEANAQAIIDATNDKTNQQIAAEEKAYERKQTLLQKQFDDEKFKTQELLKQKLAESEDTSNPKAASAAATQAQLLQQELLQIEANKNLALATETTNFNERKASLAKQSSDNETKLMQEAAELRKQVASGAISEELAAEKQLSAAKLVEVKSQQEATKSVFESRRELLEKDFNQTQEFLDKEIAKKLAEKDKLPATSENANSIQADINALTAQSIATQQAKQSAIANLEQQFKNDSAKNDAAVLNEQIAAQQRQQNIIISNFERTQKTALDVVKESETKRLIEVQKLENKGEISKAAIEENKLDLAENRINNELKLEREKLAKLQSLPVPPGQKDRLELEERIRESRLKTQELTKNSLENEQAQYENFINKVQERIEIADKERQIALEKSQRGGSVGQIDVEEELARRRVAALQAELDAGIKDKTKRLTLQLELEKAKTAAVSSGVKQRLKLLEDEITNENIALEQQLNDGTKSESDAGVIRAAQRIRELKEQISLEKNNKDDRLKLQLELVKAQGDLIDANIAKRKSALEKENTLENIALQQRLNAGLEYQADAAALRAEQQVRTLTEEIKLENDNSLSQLKLKEQLEKAKGDLADANIAKLKARLDREATIENIALLKRINQGKETDERIAVIRAAQKVKLLQAEIALETKNKDNRLKLEEQLQEALGAEIQAQLAERKAIIETANLEYQNQLEQQNQLIQRQSALYEVVEQALEQRNKLLEASKSLAQATTDLLVGELSVLSSIEKSEFRKRQLAETIAAIKFKSLKQQQEFERISLENQITQNKLALEREAIQNRINQSQKLVAIAQAKGEIEVLKADPRSNTRQGQAQLQALQSKLEAENFGLTQLQLQAGLIGEQQSSSGRFAAQQRQQLKLQQRLQETQALGEIVSAAPLGRQGRLRKSLQQRVSEDFGVGSFKELRDRGVALSRQVQSEELNGTNSPDIFGAFDDRLDGFRDGLNGSQFNNAFNDTKSRFNQQFGNTANIDQLRNDVRAAPLQIPSFTGAIPTSDLKLETSSKLFATSTDKLVDFLKTNKSSVNTYNIKVDSNGRARNAQGKENQVPSLEQIIDYAKELAAI